MVLPRRPTVAPASPRASSWSRLGQRLLRLSLFAKLLIANSGLVALGATVGTYVTALHVKASPNGPHYELMALFAAGGLALSLVINAVVLRTALWPLERLERTAHRVLAGDLDARASLGAIGDPATDQLAHTFNAMLDRLAARQRQVETYSARLQELSDRVLLAQEDERRRLAAELHDETGQLLSSLLLQLRLFRDAAAKPGAAPAALAEQASGLTDLAREVLDGVRRLALELRPRMLDDLGLAAALRAYTEEWSARTKIPVRFAPALPTERALPSAAEIAIYRMVQEALANVARHAAASQVDVALAEQADALLVEVRDNGIGFVPEHVSTKPVSADVMDDVTDGAVAPRVAQEAPLHAAGRAASQAGQARRAGSDAGLPTSGLGAGLGLFSMQERIALAGGTLRIESAPGQGTTVQAVVPLTRSVPPAEPPMPPVAAGGYPVPVSGVR